MAIVEWLRNVQAVADEMRHIVAMEIVAARCDVANVRKFCLQTSNQFSARRSSLYPKLLRQQRGATSTPCHFRDLTSSRRSNPSVTLHVKLKLLVGVRRSQHHHNTTPAGTHV